MAESVDNLMLEHLKKIQSEQTASRERDAEMLSRLAHVIVKLKARTKRVERWLELQS